MSIKNPLPGHQYGRSEPGYWYPRDDPPRRPAGPKWIKHRSRQVLGCLVAVLVVAVAADIAHVHRKTGSTSITGIYNPTPAVPSPTAPVLTAPPTTASAAPTGYPGAQAGDQPAASNGAATVHGIQVTASRWVRMSIDGGQRAVCLTASISNKTAAEIAHGPQDWSLQSPTGDVHPPTVILYDSGSPAGQPPALHSGS
jgi:hypothetical protein